MQTAAASATSEFIRQTLPGLLDRYAITYLAEGDCIEYFLVDRANDQWKERNGAADMEFLLISCLEG